MQFTCYTVFLPEAFYDFHPEINNNKLTKFLLYYKRSHYKALAYSSSLFFNMKILFDSLVTIIRGFEQRENQADDAGYNSLITIIKNMFAMDSHL